MRFTSHAWLAITVLGLTDVMVPAPKAAEPDCSKWTLDGYRLGMQGDELLAVRSVTLHVEGQAQAIESGKLHGVLVLDSLNRLEKWEATYDSPYGEDLRSELNARLGEPTSDVSGILWDDGADTARQRRTIWWSTPCDAAIIVYENTRGAATSGRIVSATLARTAVLPQGLAKMNSLFH